MNKLLSLLLSIASLFLLFLENGLAQTALFKDGILTIPHAAVTGEQGVDYFSDVQLQANSTGGFDLVAAEQQGLVNVESIAVNVMKSLPIQVAVVVTGYKSVPCVKLLEPGVFFEGGSFTIALAESKLGIAETCIAVIDPFETSIDLDITGLSSGTYSVEVNGVTGKFNLTVVPLQDVRGKIFNGEPGERQDGCEGCGNGGGFEFSMNGAFVSYLLPGSDTVSGGDYTQKGNQIIIGYVVWQIDAGVLVNAIREIILTISEDGKTITENKNGTVFTLK